MLLVGLCGIGVLAGLCCGVLVLLPLSLLAAMLALAIGWSTGSGPHALDIVMSVITCQGGYMVGLTGQSAAMDLIARLRAAPSNRA